MKARYDGCVAPASSTDSGDGVTNFGDGGSGSNGEEHEGENGASSGREEGERSSVFIEGGRGEERATGKGERRPGSSWRYQWRRLPPKASMERAMGREKRTRGARGLQGAVGRRCLVAAGCCSGSLGARGRGSLGAVGARSVGARGAGRALTLGGVGGARSLADA